MVRSSSSVTLATAVGVATATSIATPRGADAIKTVRVDKVKAAAGLRGSARVTSRMNRARLTAIFVGKNKNNSFLRQAEGRTMKRELQSAHTRRLTGIDSCQCGDKEKNYKPSSIPAFAQCGDDLSGDCVIFNEWEFFASDNLPADTMRYRYWSSALNSQWKMQCYAGVDPLEILVCPPGKKVRFELPVAAHSIVDITVRDSVTNKVDMVASYENFRHCRFPNDATVLSGLERAANVQSFEFECTTQNRGCHVLADPGTLDTGNADFDATSFSFCKRDNLRSMIQVVSQQDWDNRNNAGVDITRTTDGYGCRDFLKPALQHYCKGSYLECGSNATAVELDYDPTLGRNAPGQCSIVGKSAGSLRPPNDLDALASTGSGKIEEKEESGLEFAMRMFQYVAVAACVLGFCGGVISVVVSEMKDRKAVDRADERKGHGDVNVPHASGRGGSGKGHAVVDDPHKGKNIRDSAHGHAKDTHKKHSSADGTAALDAQNKSLHEERVKQSIAANEQAEILKEQKRLEKEAAARGDDAQDVMAAFAAMQHAGAPPQAQVRRSAGDTDMDIKGNRVDLAEDEREF